jgi:hypothetical protein
MHKRARLLQTLLCWRYMFPGQPSLQHSSSRAKDSQQHPNGITADVERLVTVMIRVPKEPCRAFSNFASC